MPSADVIKSVRLTTSTLRLAAQELAARDKQLHFLLERHGPPPLWARPQGFTTLIRIILEQQVSLASAASVFRRLEQHTVPFKPERFLELGPGHLKALGLTRQKTEYCLHLAQVLVEKRIDLRLVARMNDADAKAALIGLKGIGSWSADIYLLMALRRADVWPSGDLALAVALGSLMKVRKTPTAEKLINWAEPWRPYRAVAARMLWQYYLAQRAGKETPKLQLSIEKAVTSIS